MTGADRRMISIHALRAEGDLDGAGYKKRFDISIHALRAEGDKVANVDEFWCGQFLSTPSVRRATVNSMMQHLLIF